MAMTPHERLLGMLTGNAVDRIPIYTQIPFGLTESGFKPAPFHGYEDYDPWREQDPLYWDLVRRMEQTCDNFFIWRPPCLSPAAVFIPPALVTALPPEVNEDTVSFKQVLPLAGGSELSAVRATKRGQGHSWQVKHWCDTAEEARTLLQLPWEGHPAVPGDFFQLQEWLGERGAMWVTVPSPVLAVSQLFEPTTFLLFTRSERSLIRQLLDLAAERITHSLDRLLAAGVGPIVRFGGAEYVTPPLLSPADFDEFLAAYDKPLMDLCHRYNCLVAVHCHGNLKYALEQFVPMGVDLTDPVEAFPDGDLTLAEARRIAGDQITLCGNIQMRDLYNGDQELITRLVEQFIEQAGPKRCILTTTGTPLETMSTRLADNYHCFIEAGLRCGALG